MEYGRAVTLGGNSTNDKIKNSQGRKRSKDKMKIIKTPPTIDCMEN